MDCTALFRHPSCFFGVEAGDLIVVQSAVAPPYTCLACHPIPINYGALLADLERGTADLLSPSVSLTKLAAAVAYGAGPRPAWRPASHQPRRYGPLLVRLK